MNDPFSRSLYLFVIILSSKYISTVFNGEIENITSVAIREDKQFLFPVFGVGLVRFENGICTGYGSLMGTCYTRRQCRNANGIGSSRCANNIGVCCVLTRSCGQQSRINNTYFVSPGYPGAYTGGGVCSYTIQKIDANVCQVRIDFLTLRLAQPDTNGICNTDALTVTGGASNVPILCGENSGQHIYVDFNNASDIVISIGTTGTTVRTWNIRISQINCNCPTRAPSGCLQYYNTTTGTVTSFNYGSAARENSTRQLANENYGICIAMIAGYCGIQWSQTNLLSFGLSGNSYTNINDGTIGTAAAALSGANCLTDFIVIPGPVMANGVAVNADRFCGNAFVTAISNTKPFVLTVVNDANEAADMGNVGFSLNFAQIRCPITTTN